ncbi:hypothetical protein Q4F19_21210 [Sphingomonas sp. BIUV-7]|uniref:Phytoene synthase n=1 Tax=Sphingomonas natans TaxID=3063330 RepID=A0ABT8YEX9_9SPHN|nr:squalene/phytoene synthase family protein [Sphingomonas sp. BIUV-7]MDO6416917.1 hypothetical protein [Sphingomonas sp. BIUV-7]
MVTPLHQPSAGRHPRAGAELTLADPERALIVTYAPAHLRPGLSALFALDERLGMIVARTTEPTIGLIRLAWWREALQRLDHAAPPAEPLLASLATNVLPRGPSGEALAAIEDGWAALLDAEDVVVRHGHERGGNLFLAAGHLLGTDDDRIEPAGEAWALADLAHRHSDAAIRTEARRRAAEIAGQIRPGSWPRAARPLGALAALARWDAASDGLRRQGSPARLARMLVRRLTGR